MPRKRDPNEPIKERTKLDTVEQINAELRRTYRLFVNKAITHAEMSRRRELLVALRAGLPDPIERPASSAIPTIVNVSSAAEGMQYLPGNEVLMPFEEAGIAWKAYNGGVKTWAAYLAEVEPQLTKSAFENLSRVVPLDRETLVLHDLARPRLVSLDDDHAT